MVIQSWIIVGLIAGCLIGVMIGKSFGIVGDIILGFIGGLAGGCLASIVFVVAGTINGINVFAAIIAFSVAVILVRIKRVVVRPTASPA